MTGRQTYIHFSITRRRDVLLCFSLPLKREPFLFILSRVLLFRSSSLHLIHPSSLFACRIFVLSPKQKEEEKGRWRCERENPSDGQLIIVPGKYIQRVEKKSSRSRGEKERRRQREMLDERDRQRKSELQLPSFVSLKETEKQKR